MDKACPKCGGTKGHEHVMTESHKMASMWGDSAEAVDSGPSVRPVVRSLVRCIDCGARFSHTALVRKGLV